MSVSYELIGASIFTVFCVLLAKVYSLVNRAYTYWDRKNVNGPRPVYVVGTWEGFAHKFLGNEDCGNRVKYGKVYGTYDGLTPNLLVTDPEIIKQVLDSSSESFQDVRFLSENSVVLKDSLKSLCGGDKSQVQMLINSLLNPTKFEKLVPKLNLSVEALIQIMAKDRQEDGRLNVTSSVADFINDVIALTIFGIKLNADVHFKEEFDRSCRKIFKVKDPQSVMSLLPFLYGNFFKENWICPDKTLQYFVNLILNEISRATRQEETTEEKECNLIELMVEAAKEEKKLVKTDSEKEETEADLVLKDSIIISKSIATLLTLLNMTKTTVLLGLHALANNEAVQEKLYQEVEKSQSEKVSYENIQNMKYLDQVVKEILRMYPFEFRVEKVASKNIKIGDIELEKDVRVSIPLYALHRSEDFYTEPDTFDPERFAPNTPQGHGTFSYLPFGQAGINGSDFSIQIGILVSKITLCKLVNAFKFSGAQERGLHGLFKKGFTRTPQPQDIDIVVQNRT
ncbi:hypothetical protein RUM44_007935 [Polyplax serrata]|uniref:Cytochrome P450 n=1 Tax=Polyplax serrata TaxID=468196 RepID=A0ABR1BBR8_POLSC